MCATPTLVSMEPPVWRAQTLTNACACRATEGNAVRSVWDPLQLINTNSSLSELRANSIIHHRHHCCDYVKVKQVNLQPCRVSSPQSQTRILTGVSSPGDPILMLWDRSTQSKYLTTQDDCSLSWPQRKPPFPEQWLFTFYLFICRQICLSCQSDVI